MKKLFLGYLLSVGLWIGHIALIMLALTLGDASQGTARPMAILTVSLFIILVVCAIGLLVWSIKGIKNGTIPKAGIGIILITGVWFAYYIFLTARFGITMSEYSKPFIK